MSNSICLQKIARNFKAGAPHLCTLLAQFVRACWPSKSAHIQTRAHKHSHWRSIHVYMYTKTWHIHRERVKHVDECETEIETESSSRRSSSTSRDISEMANTTSNNKRHKKKQKTTSRVRSAGGNGRRIRIKKKKEAKEEIFRICSNMLLHFVLCVLYFFLYCTWKLLHISNSESYRSFIIRYARYAALLLNI